MQGKGDVVSLPYKHSQRECPLCESKDALFDDLHYEYFCSKCGCVLESPPIIQEPAPVFLAQPVEGYTYNSNCGISPMTNSRVDLYHGDKSKWNRSQYKRYISIISNNLCLTNYQKKRAEYLIDHITDFRPLCGNNHDPTNVEQIITSICLLLMRIDHNKVDINQNEFCRNLKLSLDKFCKIIYKLQGKYGYILRQVEHEYMED